MCYFQIRFTRPDTEEKQCVCLDMTTFVDFPNVIEITIRLTRQPDFNASDLFVVGCSADAVATTVMTTEVDQTSTASTEVTTLTSTASTEVTTLTSTVSTEITTLRICGKV